MNIGMDPIQGGFDQESVYNTIPICTLQEVIQSAFNYVFSSNAAVAACLHYYLISQKYVKYGFYKK